MDVKPFISLCIPTNGVTEWVVPVLESIYSNDCDINEYEVVVTDNSKNSEFEKAMSEYKNKYSNFMYKKTNAIMFLNQIEAFKLANGQLIKFLNHRMILFPNSVNYLIDFVKTNHFTEPVVYFSNGVLQIPSSVKCCYSFDEYVKTLSYFSSWSAGTAIWKNEFDQMNPNIQFNKLFPHTDIIFNNRNSTEYIVDDTPLMKEIPVDVTKKGNYDLFDAFAVQYPSIIQHLYEDGNITKSTYKFVIRKNSFFVSELFLDYVMKKDPCSYDLHGYKNSTGKFYGDIEIKSKAFLLLMKRIVEKIIKK